jgi:hypothetical protein
MSSKTESFKKGDKVRITRQDVSRIRCPYGVIKRIDGFLVYVKPIWYPAVIELYQSEITHAEEIWNVEKQKPNIVIKKIKR